MIYLTAPLDVQETAAYESALGLLYERYGCEQVYADRDITESMRQFNKVWKSVYDPEKADRLYVLAREDGTIGHGTYRQHKRLSTKHDVPATLLLPHGEQAAEVGGFTVSLIEETERSDRVFAVVSPESARSGSNGAKKKAAGESPRRMS